MNELGVSEAVIQNREHTIRVDLPGIQDIARAKSLIGKTATLKFQIVAPGPAPGTEMKARDGRILHLDPYVALTGQSIISARAICQIKALRYRYN